MKKNLKVLRKAGIGDTFVWLQYWLINNQEQRQDFDSLSRNVFPSLNEDEIEKIFKEKISEVEKLEIKNYIVGTCMEIWLKKEKQEIKETHKRIMKVLKEIIKELEQEEKKKNLEQWLWKEKEIEI